MLHVVAQDDPAVLRTAFPAGRVRHVNRFVVAKPALAEDGHGASAGVVAQNPAGAARGILGVSQRKKKTGADRDPQYVDPDKTQRPATRNRRRDGGIIPAAMTRREIEQKLIGIVRQEKPDLPAEQLTPETLLADAGIDSLDALTILFAVEETFKISVPDDRARSMKTFDDMIEAVVALIPAS